ncbi:MAG: hypothetical protein NZ585_05265 [Chloracidobacterium sp.]|nr:hypothetical protein [Chloracidobacterium sp.]MDW8216896.1 hypothetical protein [Acidobacteriota bacterium]
MLFDAQLEALYVASRFDENTQLVDLGGLGQGGLAGAQMFVDAMCSGEAELVSQDFIRRSKATEFGSAPIGWRSWALAKLRKLPSIGVQGARYSLESASLEYEVADIKVTVEPSPRLNQPLVVGGR